MSPSGSNNNKKNKNSGTNNLPKQKHPTEDSNLKLNPIADWMKRKKTNINKKSNGKGFSNDIKQGLFSRQQLKLEKAKQMEEKKKKSKKSKNSVAALRAAALKPVEIIDLDSDNDSNSSDVIVIPTAPLPTFTVDDSGDEEKTTDKENITMQHEENAVDSTDVELSSTTASFIKPKEVCTQSLISVDCDDKRLENSSRCTSPCSIQSSDDFIRSVDHVRLLSGGRTVADDEDLLELTSDANILSIPSDISKQKEDQVCLERNTNQQQEMQEENVQTSDTSQFTTPKALNVQSGDYRVDQSQFKALDVYESESDITDNVYSKGANKSTVIRQIDSSCDDVEDISTFSHRTKRLRKRRASNSNKDSDPNNESVISSTENEDSEDDNRVLRTSVPYIAKGPAVEHYKSQNCSRSLSACSSYLQRNKSSKVVAACGNTSDTEFLATLNSLAHGQDEEQETQKLDESDISEAENVPTAREMAEQILSHHNTKANNSESFTDDMALPTDILNDLDKVFETIDQLDKENSKPLPTYDNAVEILECSQSDREQNFSYPSVPNESAEIIKLSPKKSGSKARDKNGSPIYNVIYVRGLRKAGGIGWGDEMRKFYNESWNGEQLTLRHVLAKMSRK